MRKEVVVTLASALAIGVPGVASADTVDSNWKNWGVVGPPPSLTTESRIAASGTTTAIVRGGNDSDQLSYIWIIDSAGQRLGTAPTALGSDVPTVAVPNESRVIVGGNCNTATTTNGGKSWKTVALPGCDSRTSPALSISASGAGFATVGKTSWQTTDGGESWSSSSTVSSPTLPNADAYRYDPVAAVAKDIGLRIVNGYGSGSTLERTVDGGKSWTTVAVPNAAGAPITEIPKLSQPVRRANGSIVIGARDGMYVSNDQGANFSRVALPPTTKLPGASTFDVDNIACDTNSNCVVRVASANRYAGRQFSGSAFGKETMAPPPGASAPQANVVVGLQPAADTGTPPSFIRSTDLGESYTVAADGATSTGSLGTHGVISVQRGSTLWTSFNHGATWLNTPVPNAQRIVDVANANGAVTALSSDGIVRRFSGNAWDQLADASAVSPVAMAATGGKPIVAGSKGVALIDGNAVKVISSSVLAGRSFNAVSAAGSTAVVSTSKFNFYSKNGGATWAKSKLAGVTDLQVINSKAVVAIYRGKIVVSTDRGKTFKVKGKPVDVLSKRGSAQSLEFVNAKLGIIKMSSGLIVITRDGGKSFTPLPTPNAVKPSFASPSGTGVMLQDPETGNILRNSTLLKTSKKSKITFNLAKSGSKSRIVGFLKNAPNGARVRIVSQKTKNGTPSLVTSAGVNADGSFRVFAKIKARYVAVQYLGAVTEPATYQAVSKVKKR